MSGGGVRISNEFPGEGRFDGRHKTIICRSAGARRAQVFTESPTASFAVAVEIAPNVIEFGRLVLVPDRTALDVYEDALWRARKALKTGLGAGDVDEAPGDLRSCSGRRV